MLRRIFSFFLTALLSITAVCAAEKVSLTLGDAIKMANDSSLAAFRYQNLYAAGYWKWRTFKANRLPSLSLNLMPAQYNRYITQRYNYDEDIDVYRSQQIYLATAGLKVLQNVDFLGGTIYLETGLEYMRNFGAYKSNQFSSIPVRIGYSQSLIGYNEFKWEKKIEPLQYEKARREFIYNMESVSEEVVTYFFALAMAQTEYRLAKDNLASCDTLYTIGERRFKIASISSSELLTLRLDKVNAENALENALISIKRARFALASYLGMNTDTEIDIVMPGTPSVIDIPLGTAIEQAQTNNPTLLGHQSTMLEARRDLSKAKAEARFNATVNASVGFNQVANKLPDAYHNLMRQDLVSVSVSVPLIDWGVRRGKVNIAHNNLNIAEIAARQDELSIEQDVTMTVNDFATQQRLVASAIEALDLADLAYSQTRQRFIIGKADINSLTLAHNRQQDASKNYINSLQNYWLSYYKIRKLTLFDFELNKPISILFDRSLGL
ncbi:MAG: TolC family protein [Muribaculaceae bacterium]|nr:TolC family protein [Muribaculaceae bacterium]